MLQQLTHLAERHLVNEQSIAQNISFFHIYKNTRAKRKKNNRLMYVILTVSKLFFIFFSLFPVVYVGVTL